MEKDSSTTAAAMLALSLTRLPTPAPTRVSSRAVVGAIESAVVKEQIRQQLPSGTSSDDTSDEQPTPKAAAALRQRNDAGEKKRKPTYYMRKDEMAQLQEEIATLQATIRQLETKSMCVTQTLGTALDWNTNLRSRVRHGDLTVARAQSLLSSFGIQHRTPPLGGFIHLPRNVVDRQRTLSALKMPRIQEALAYTLARSQFLDVTKTTCQFDTFETDTGDFVTTHWEITPLHDARSVRHAFEEVLYFYETHEMTLSEKLGVLSIRESESEMVDGAQAVRLLSKHDNGAQVEANLALFSQYFEKSEMLDQPHAVMAVDYVDQDDLYSFQPQSRIHKDVVSSVIIMEAPASRGSSTSGPPVVTMIRLAFVRVNSSTYTSRSVLEQVARDGGGKWCDVMLKCVLERLTWRS